MADADGEKSEMGWLLGLMSGTSMDGIDAALIRSDGARVLETGPATTLSYDSEFRERLRAILGQCGPVEDVERELTLRHAEAVRQLLGEAGLVPDEVALIGFHGQTIDHVGFSQPRPSRRR